MADEALQNELMREIFGSPFKFEEDQTDASFNENDNGYEIENEKHPEEDEEHDAMEKEAHEQIENDEDAMYGDEERDGFEGDNAYQEIVQNGPKYGMIFQSEIEKREAYKAYAKAKGFGISYRNRSSTKYLLYKCDRGRKSEGKKYSKRINCPARLNATHKGGDDWMVHVELQQNDRDFFYLFDLDDNSRLRNVMWIHPRSRATYEDFHDVVSLDTTYLVNQYNMPFGSIVGVNYHSQSIILGCCLLTNETAESFKWFFRNWLDAMGGIQPMEILSDQDESIRIALREIMPESIHLFCIWHLVSKVSKKFKGIADVPAAKCDFNSMIYDSVSIFEFETMWPAFKNKYGLQNSRWLKDLYAERESWVPIYSNHVLWTDMSYTQRSESMHAFFDHYINYRSTLKIFVEQYEIAVTEKFRKELRAQYSSKCGPMICVSSFKWEGQFSRAYTNNIMNLFQAEVKQMWNCNVTLHNIVGGALEMYDVLEIGRLKHWYGKEYKFEVEYRPVREYIQCNCRKFECKGILCCHILKVLTYINIEVVNERFVLRRWHKDVYRPHFSISFTGGYPVMTEEFKRYQEMEKEFKLCSDLALDSDKKIKFVKEQLTAIKKQLMAWDSSTATGVSQDTSQTIQTGSEGPRILDPLMTARK